MGLEQFSCYVQCITVICYVYYTITAQQYLYVKTSYNNTELYNYITVYTHNTCDVCS